MHNPQHISPANVILKEYRDEIIHVRHFNEDIGLDYIDLYIVHNMKSIRKYFA